MELLEFRKLNLSDEYSEKYNDGFAWSRVYEYQLVLNLLKKYYGENKDISIHNTSWGFDGIHVIFKNDLDTNYPNTIHSDIKPSNLKNTIVYDITQQPSDELKDKFDVVMNISTLEEVNFDHLKSFNNLLEQVKTGGLLIITFDYPGLQLEKFEKLFNDTLKTTDNDLNGSNSKLVNKHWSHLSCGLIILRK
jgi:SAM-dependent methyltransferase